MSGKEIPFYKLVATGNDFILFDNRNGLFSGQEHDFFHELCKRRLSVGADGILLIENSRVENFRMRYYNADGRESEMCGNGARAAAYWAYLHNLVPAEMSFEVHGNRYEALVQGNRVRLKMPPASNLQLNPGILKETELEEGGVIHTGVPHYVLFCNSVASVDVEKLGKKYRWHHYFQPSGTNVNFVELVSPSNIKIRTFERGVEEETLACGTGTVASALLTTLCKGGRLPMKAETPGGKLMVYGTNWQEPVYLEGEVKLVYRGVLVATK